MDDRHFPYAPRRPCTGSLQIARQDAGGRIAREFGPRSAAAVGGFRRRKGGLRPGGRAAVSPTHRTRATLEFAFNGDLFEERRGDTPSPSGHVGSSVVLARRSRNSASMADVEQLPRRIQTTFGGGPNTNARALKSESFVTTMHPCVAAYCQTASSSARPSPTAPTWTISGHTARRRSTRRCDRF